MQLAAGLSNGETSSRVCWQKVFQNHYAEHTGLSRLCTKSPWCHSMTALHSTVQSSLFSLLTTLLVSSRTETRQTTEGWWAVWPSSSHTLMCDTNLTPIYTDLFEQLTIGFNGHLPPAMLSVSSRLHPCKWLCRQRLLVSALPAYCMSSYVKGGEGSRGNISLFYPQYYCILVLKKKYPVSCPSQALTFSFQLSEWCSVS